MPLFLLATSTAEWIAGSVVAVVIALVIGFGTAYGMMKKTFREQHNLDQDANRENRRKDAEANLVQVEKENSLWRAECERLIKNHVEDRTRWTDELKSVWSMVDTAERRHRAQIEDYERQIIDMREKIIELEARK